MLLSSFKFPQLVATPTARQLPKRFQLAAAPTRASLTCFPAARPRAAACMCVRASVSAVGELGRARPAFRPECLGAHFQMVMRLNRSRATEWK